jgi:hypothetical protein
MDMRLDLVRSRGVVVRIACALCGVDHRLGHGLLIKQGGLYCDGKVDFELVVSFLHSCLSSHEIV